jgi:hypothetical protein
MILVHDLGSHWRICEPFSSLRMLIAASWCTMLFLPHTVGGRHTERFGCFTCALCDYCDVQFVERNGHVGLRVEVS